ncbi:MAG: alpha/beta fold hydrolase [Chitinophagaceae bacterium]|nr:MAG: alpha/beta fold hydrolase [Chitinophagaceae bacterium]
MAAGRGTPFVCSLPMHEHFHTLPDGRRLCYARFGDPAALPVLYFHGTPSSRLEPLLLEGFGYRLDALLAEAGLQLISIDRPGMGGSDYRSGERYRSFAHDTEHLCAALGLPPLPVLCWSGGGPYALAMAAQFPSRISSVHIVCGFTRPFDKEILQQMGSNKWYFRAARYAPFLLAPALHAVRRHGPKRLPPQGISGLPWEDYHLLDRPDTLGPMTRCTVREAARRGALGPIMEARAYYAHFPYRLAAIAQPLHYWWGSRDMSVARAHAEAVEQYAPRATMHYRPGEGHLSVYVHCMKEILQVVRSGQGDPSS